MQRTSGEYGLQCIVSEPRRAATDTFSHSPPNGEGVNVALHDSLQLAEQIAKFGIEHLDEAVVEYEKLMVPRAKATMEDSAWMDKAMFAEDAPAGLLQAFQAAMEDGAQSLSEV